MVIRKAAPEDREAVAGLLLVIFKDMELPLLQRISEEKLVQMVVEAMADPMYRYNESRGIVNEIDGKLAGIAFGYPDEEEPTIDLAWDEVAKAHQLTGDTRLFKDSEVFPNEWYLDSVCVNEAFRGKGIGSSLLESVVDLARQAGKSKIGLCCDFTNHKAQKLYERVGYEVVGEQVLSNHRYYHMQKNI